MYAQDISPNLNILLVDDDIRIQRTLKIILKESGFKNIHTADNGAEALQMLRKWGIDLVFLDWDMPQMNGGEVLEKMQRSNMMQHTKVVMLTAHSEKEHVLSAIQFGASKFIVKPFTPIDICQKIEEVFSANLVKKNKPGKP